MNMKQHEGLNMRCSLCGNAINSTGSFCPNCGALFEEGIRCKRHATEKASGACIICCKPYCATCGNWSGGLFMCGEHHGYEVVEGMARVLGGSDNAQVEYAKNCLEQNGLHPFVFSRKASPISLGGPDYSLFNASGEFDGHIINEYKLMVPCQEVIKAVQVLKKLDLVETHRTD